VRLIGVAELGVRPLNMITPSISAFISIVFFCSVLLAPEGTSEITISNDQRKPIATWILKDYRWTINDEFWQVRPNDILVYKDGKYVYGINMSEYSTALYKQDLKETPLIRIPQSAVIRREASGDLVYEKAPASKKNVTLYITFKKAEQDAAANP